MDVTTRDKCFHDCGSNGLGSIPGAVGRMLEIVDYPAFRNAVVFNELSKKINRFVGHAG